MEPYQLEKLWQMFCSFEEEKWHSYFQSLELAKTLTNFCENNPMKPVYGNNVLSYLNLTEPRTSWIIREILAYREKGEYPVLQDFLIQVFKSEHKVDCPKITAEKGRIDVLVRDSTYVLIIENKLKGADYQPHQLARYISRMRKEQPNKEILLALIPDRISKNYVADVPLPVWRLPDHGIECRSWCKDSRDFSLCDNCRSFKEEVSKTEVLTDNFVEWLSLLIKSEIIPERETRLISTIHLFSDYLNKIYNIDINKNYTMDVQDFLKRKLDLKGQDIKSKGDDLEKIQAKLAEVNELQVHLIKLLDSEEHDFIEKCYQRIQQEYPGLRLNIHHPNRQGWETGIEIEYKNITMWVHINSHNFDDHNTPRWGLWVENVTDEEIVSINKEILANLGGRFELSRCFNVKAQLFVPSDYSSVYENWKELIDAILDAKNKIK